MPPLTPRFRALSPYRGRICHGTMTGCSPHSAKASADLSRNCLSWKKEDIAAPNQMEWSLLEEAAIAHCGGGRRTSQRRWEGGCSGDGRLRGEMGVGLSVACGANLKSSKLNQRIILINK
jgi:hypothetical protein